jgi:3-oxoacyl-[acyl-carrier protein] reductase
MQQAQKCCDRSQRESHFQNRFLLKVDIMSVTGRIALVTGGSRGIGRAIVESLARNGAKVAFVYNSNSAAADELVSLLGAEGHEVLAMQADVRSKAAADKVVADVIEKWGKLEILVNNAGIIKDGLLATMDSQQWQDVIDTNLTSVFNFCQAASRQMMSQRYGRIINMSSVAADVSNPGQANYAASKGGVEGFTRCVATELARRGITANAVAPGFIETDMTVAVVNAAGDEIKKKIPARRLGRPDDISNAVLFFASDEASYVTGQILKVDGGLTLGGL